MFDVLDATGWVLEAQDLKNHCTEMHFPKIDLRNRPAAPRFL
jgi:hypothetical protein